jgi:hypothetical protein
MVAIRLGCVVAALCLAVAPAMAGEQGVEIAAKDGRRVVFDEGTADGRHALQVRDAKDQVVREVNLGEFLPAAYIQALPHDANGLRWRREAKLAGQDRVEFTVAKPGSDAGATGPALRFSIDLRDGSVRTAQIREYLAAVDLARALQAGTALALAR